MNELVRAISAFSPETEELVWDQEFDGRLIDELRPLFDVGDDYDMVFDYAIHDDIKNEVSRITGISLAGPYDYFLDTWVRE